MSSALAWNNSTVMSKYFPGSCCMKAVFIGKMANIQIQDLQHGMCRCHCFGATLTSSDCTQKEEAEGRRQGQRESEGHGGSGNQAAAPWTSLPSASRADWCSAGERVHPATLTAHLHHPRMQERPSLGSWRTGLAASRAVAAVAGGLLQSCALSCRRHLQQALIHNLDLDEPHLS